MNQLNLAAALSLALPGCAVQTEPGWEEVLAQRILDRTVDFAPPPGLVSGTAPTLADAAPRAGDQLLYGVCLDVHGTRTIWYLHVEVLAVDTKPWLYLRKVQNFEKRVQLAAEHQPTTALPRRLNDLASEMPVAQIRVEAFNVEGESLGAAVSEEAVLRLQTGLYPACVAGHRQRGPMAGRTVLGLDAPQLELDPGAHRDVQTVAEGIAACDGFFAILENNPVTRRILFDVIALPTIWSIIKNFGVRTGFSIDFFGAQPIPPGTFADPPGDLWSAPMVVEMNDQPALLACMIAAPSGSPDGAAAGVYGLVGRHPTDLKRTVHIQRLASQRGPAP